MTATKPEEILTAIRIPKTWSRRPLLLREGRRPERLGLPAGQCRRGDLGEERRDRGLPHRLRRRQRVPRRLAAVEEIVKGKPMSEDIAKLAGQSATRGARAAELQPVQNPADGQPGDARRPRRASVEVDMELFRYATSIYGGSDVVIGASWDLLPWFVGVGAAFIILHAVVKAFAGRRGRVS